MKFLALALFATGMQAACLWDARDERLYCSFDEPAPKAKWVVPCGPALEPTRSSNGSVYCGHGKQGPIVNVAVKPADDEQPLNLECAATPHREKSGAIWDFTLKCKVVGK